MCVMPDYRAFIIGPDGIVADSHALIDMDEETAKKHAQQLAEDADVELWHLDRKIATFKAKGGIVFPLTSTTTG